MPDYRETTETTKSWRRAFAVHLSNPLDNPAGRGIVFEEEDVILRAEATTTIVVGSVSGAFIPTETFPLLNPETGEPLGVKSSHLDVYVLLNSLYADLATKRDAADAAAAEAALEPAPEIKA